MTDTEKRRPSAVLVVAVGVAAAAYVAFVYGYPRVFPDLERSHPEHYRENVARLLDEGKLETALKVAAQATRVYTESPEAFTLYGRVYLKNGRPDAAQRQFENAVAINQTPGPQYRRTSKPYYFADARLELGQLDLDRGGVLRAISQFELARSYAVLSAPEYEAFHKNLYAAYSAVDQWGRALEFGEPSGEELKTLDVEDLRALSVACEGLQLWPLAVLVAEELAARDMPDGEPDYLMGRAFLGLQQMEHAGAALGKAADAGHPDAPFFLGLALEATGDLRAAAEAFLRTGPESLFRAFALGRALLVTPWSEKEKQELSTALDDELARPRRIRSPRVFSKHRRFWPVAADYDPASFEASKVFPVLILWKDRRSAQHLGPEELFMQIEQDGTCTLKRLEHVLQLQWATNQLAFPGFEALPEHGTELPGWRKTSHLWGETEAGRTATVALDESGNRFLSVENTVPESNAMLITTPIPVDQEFDYLLAGQVRADKTEGWLVWSALDRHEEEAFANAFRTGPAEDWTWIAAYTHGVIYWDVLTVQVGVYEDVGTVGYDNLMLLAIRKPSLPAGLFGATGSES